MVKKDGPRRGSVNKPMSQDNGGRRDSVPPPPGEGKTHEVPGERSVGCRRMQR
jgi:hypothetical protein